MIRKQRINIGHLSTLYHTSFILMCTDWLEKSGIQVNWKLFASGPDTVNAFERKEIDIGYIGLPPAIIGIGRGIPLICVAGGHVEGTVLVAGSNHTPWQEPHQVNSVMRQFEGKLIGSPPKGSIHDVIINNIIDDNGLDIRVKNFPWTDFVLEAMVDGIIDAAVGTPSLAAAAARAMGARIIIPPHMLWPNNPSYGIVIHKDFLQHPDVILKFIELHEKASNFIRQNTEEAAKLVSGLTGIVEEDFVLDAYRISPKYCAALSKEFVASTMDFIPVLHRLKYISKIFSEKEIFDHSFVKKIHAQPHHYDLLL